IYKRDGGVITIEGIEEELESKQVAEEAGIAIVFQESTLIQKLTILENLFSGNPPTNRFGFIDWNAAKRKANELLDELNIGLGHHVEVGTLSTATQKMIEIARALSKDFKILILDEPTASITVEETEQLFTLIRKLKANGKSIIYISHRLKEIMDIADRVSILKDGESVGTYNISDITEKQICYKMVGRELLDFHYVSHTTEDVLLEADRISGEGFTDLSFQVRKGEFLTITGLTGAGRTELALALFGYTPIHSGTIYINGHTHTIRSPRDAMEHGIGYVTEDRQNLGLFMDMSITENMESNNIDTLQPGPFASFEKAKLMAEKNVNDFNIQCSGVNQQVRYLSGGNKQKVCLSRWISYRPRLLIVDEPTLGVDVGAKEEIYTILNALSRDGIAIIMISSDMIETLSLGDKIMVMYEGGMMQILEREQTNEQEIVSYSSGIESHEVH
ncbi:MAG: sugar ABC transporter ATP-binding protein, partial [bacterium]|nr:sugar ABC transporter ATP-binding protein [bacterium]